MAKRAVILSDRSVQSFKRIVAHLKKASLIGGEDARLAILQAIRKLGINPMAQSEHVHMPTLEGEYRSLKVWGFLVFYKVEKERVIVLDMIVDKK